MISHEEALERLAEAESRLAKVCAAVEIPNGEITSQQYWDSAAAQAKEALGDPDPYLEHFSDGALRPAGYPPDGWEDVFSLVENCRLLAGGFFCTSSAAEIIARGLGVEVVYRSGKSDVR